MLKYTRLIFLVVTICFAWQVAASGAEATWPNFRHDSQHSGRATCAGPAMASQIWQRSTDAGASSPLVANGKVFISGAEKLYCFDFQGELLWTFACKGGVGACPAIGGDGVIYFGSSDGYLYAIDQTGNQIWKKSLSATADASPTVGTDGTIYIGTRANKFFAFRKDGTIKFTYTAGGAVSSSAAIAGDGSIYFGCNDGRLYALRSTGVLKWKFSPSPLTAIKCSPAIGTDGTVYFGTSGGAFYGVWSDGRQRWRYLAGGGIYSSPAITADGSVCFGARDGNLYCLNKIGAFRWKYKAGGWIDSSPSIDSAGAVYFGDLDGSVYALDPSGNLLWSSAIAGGVVSTPAIGESQRLFVTSTEGALCAFGADVTPPTIPIVIDDGNYSTSANSLHASWSCSDPESGIARYDYAIGTTRGGQDIRAFTECGNVSEITATDLSLSNGGTYYIAVRASNTCGLVSEVGTSDGIRIDNTPPANPVVFDDGAFSADPNEFHIFFTSGDTESGIARFEYCLGTAPGLSDVFGWTDSGAVKERTIVGLSLRHCQKYFATVRAYNHAGLMSVGSSNGISIDLTKPDVKSLQANAMSGEIRATVNAEDAESGIDAVQYVLLNSPQVPLTPEWFSAEPGKEIVIAGPFDWTKSYYVAARVQNAAGSWSDVSYSDRIFLNGSVPSVPVVIDDGDYTYSSSVLHATWSAYDTESGVAEYLYCIGTTPGGQDVCAWKSNSYFKEVTVENLSLVQGVKYYFAVKAKNGAGVVGPVGVSDGIEYKFAPSSWPKFRQNLQNTGCANVSGPSSASVKWRTQMPGYLESSVAVSPDGTMYLGCSDGKLYAILANGSTKWTYQTGGCIDSSPALDADGCIYFGSYDGCLYCLYPNGTLRWRFRAGDMIWSSPAVISDGTVYFGCQDGYLYALYPNGSLKWRYATRGAVWSSPVVTADGCIAIGSGDGKLYLISSLGMLRWSYQTGSAIDSSPAIGADGSIYFGSGDGFVYALSSNGYRKWMYYVGRVADASAAVTADRVYFGTGAVGSGGALYSFDLAGKLQWRIGFEGALRSSPAVDKNGTVYCGRADSSVFAVTSSGSILWQYQTDASILASPAILMDGSVVVGTDNGSLYCFKK